MFPHKIKTAQSKDPTKPSKKEKGRRCQEMTFKRKQTSNRATGHQPSRAGPVEAPPEWGHWASGRSASCPESSFKMARATAVGRHTDHAPAPATARVGRTWHGRRCPSVPGEAPLPETCPAPLKDAGCSRAQAGHGVLPEPATYTA